MAVQVLDWVGQRMKNLQEGDAMRWMNDQVSKSASRSLAVGLWMMVMWLIPIWVWADTAKQNQPVATIEAAASQDVLQDFVQATVFATATGATAAEVNTALTNALAQVKRGIAVREGVTISTGQFSTYLNYNDKREVVGWAGRAGLLISGKNLQGVAMVLSQVGRSLAIGSVWFSLSPEVRREQEQALLKTLAQAFTDKAMAVTAAFGFGSYEVMTLNFSENAAGRSVPMMARAASPRMDASNSSVSLEPALTTVSVSVTGQIRLNK